MGADESNSYQKIDEYIHYMPKKEVQSQNECLKGQKINPLNKSKNNDLLSFPDNLNNENNENNDNINEMKIIGGNSSQGNKLEIEDKLDCLSVDDHLKMVPKHQEKIRIKNLRIDKKRMFNKIEEEKNIEIEIDKNNYETFNAPKMLTSKNFYNKKIKYNKNDEEENKKEEKIISKNENINEEKVSNIKSISKNFQINNDDKIDDDFINDINIQHKKNISIRKRYKQQKYNNIEENYNTFNDESTIKPLIKGEKIVFRREEYNKQKKLNVNMENNNNINYSIKIDDKISNNINKRHEIKQNNKDEDDDFESNLKINDIIESKKSLKKSINVEIKINPTNENDNEIQKRKMVRYNSYSNFLLNDKIPKKVFLFDKPNIFDSFLIILNNSIFMTNYYAKNSQKIENYIKQNEEKKEYYLFGILYYINKYLWDKRPEDLIPKDELRNMYKSFMDYFIKSECKNSNPELYLYDINNIESIIQFIFSRIDFEQTNERKDSNNWKNDKGDKQLNDFLSNYTKNHKSIITDKYTGFYISEETCSNCLEKEARNNNIYQPKREYTDFYYISFDCKKYNEAYINIQRTRGYSYNPNINGNENAFNQLNNFNFNLNIYFMLEQEFNLLKMEFCNICHISSNKKIKKKFLSLPNVLNTN